jgi:isoquinoline 1-oxidoreductase alpha subunit
MSVIINVNGTQREVTADPETPLLYGLRNDLQLKGARYGCGGGFCGACTVLVDRAPMRSCVTPVSALAGRSVTTIEGLGEGGLHAVQKAWIEEDVPQCGYCQAGQILSAVALLERTPDPAPADVDTITNLCRCGTYVRIRRAIARAAKDLKARA